MRGAVIRLKTSGPSRLSKNFPRALKAHIDGLPETTPVEIWFEDEARIGQKNGQGSAMGQARNAAKAARRPALRQRLSVRRDLPGTRGVGAALARCPTPTLP